MSGSEDNIEGVSFFKVPFLSALDLVQSRQVIVKRVSCVTKHSSSFLLTNVLYIHDVTSGVHICAKEQPSDRLTSLQQV